MSVASEVGGVDSFATSETARDGFLVPGVEMQATILDNLRHGLSFGWAGTAQNAILIAVFGALAALLAWRPADLWTLAGGLGLVALLDPDATLTSDGGGKVSAARRPVLGAVNVARFILGVLTQRPDARVDPIATADGLGFIVSENGVVDTVMVLGVRADRVSDVWLVRNPDKLTSWR